MKNRRTVTKSNHPLYPRDGRSAGFNQSAGGSMPSCSADQPDRLLIASAFEILLEQLVEHRPVGPDARKAAQDLSFMSSGEPKISSAERPSTPRAASAISVSRGRDGVGQIRLGLGERLDGEPPGGGTEAEPVELREDVPHPVASLPPVPDLGKHRLVVAFLRRTKRSRSCGSSLSSVFLGSDTGHPPRAVDEGRRVRPVAAPSRKKRTAARLYKVLSREAATPSRMNQSSRRGRGMGSPGARRRHPSRTYFRTEGIRRRAIGVTGLFVSAGPRTPRRGA